MSLATRQLIAKEKTREMCIRVTAYIKGQKIIY